MFFHCHNLDTPSHMQGKPDLCFPADISIFVLDQMHCRMLAILWGTFDYYVQKLVSLRFEYILERASSKVGCALSKSSAVEHCERCIFVL